MLQSCLANGHVKFLVNLSRDENTCLLIVNCLAYHYFDYFTLSIDSCGVKIDIRSVLYFCTVWTGAHNAINWSETNTHLFYFTYYIVCTSLKSIGIKNRSMYSRSPAGKYSWSNFCSKIETMSRTWQLKHFHLYKY